MKLGAFKFLTDENIQGAIVDHLKQLNLDILDVKESGLSGSDDAFLLDLAYTQQRVILTHDSDFGTLLSLLPQKIRAIVLKSECVFFDELPN